MKRLCIVLSLVLLLVVLALPAVARADDPAPTPDGWTWDESTAPSVTPDGWTWDEL
jgi:hypothetical protein